MLAELAVPYADSSAAALRWEVDGPCPEPLATVRVVFAAGCLELAVLGSSHAATLVVGDAVTTETVACTTLAGQPLPASAERLVAVGRYRFRSATARLGHDGVRREVATVADFLADRADAIVARFPGDSDAVTALAATPRRGGIGWRTWHAYPERGELVVTATEVGFP